MRNRSTLSNLLEYRVFLSEALESGGQVDSVYTDYSKAFDRVDHGLLKRKLIKWGFSPRIVSWIYSFITNRVQTVKIYNFVSRDISVNSGVPQGSHCGPILFTIFVNDLFDCIKYSHCLMFADDMKIFKAINNHDDHLRLQCDLNEIYEWSLLNKLELNIEKCHSISFTRSRSPLDYIYSIG